MTLDFNQLKYLVMAAQNGDAQAYEKFLAAIHPYLTTIIRRKLSNILDVEDIAQNCLIGIHKSLPTFDPSRALAPWLNAIISYKVSDQLRSVYRRPVTKDALPANNVNESDNGPNLENKLDARHKLELISEQLPENLKRALYLTQVSGLDYSQAAKSIGISEVALRKRVSRAYKAIGEIFKGEMEKT